MVALEAFSPPAPLEEGSVTHDVSCILVEDDRNSTGLSEKWEPLKAELPEYVQNWWQVGFIRKNLGWKVMRGGGGAILFIDDKLS